MLGVGYMYVGSTARWGDFGVQVPRAVVANRGSLAACLKRIGVFFSSDASARGGSLASAVARLVPVVIPATPLAIRTLSLRLVFDVVGSLLEGRDDSNEVRSAFTVLFYARSDVSGLLIESCCCLVLVRSSRHFPPKDAC